MFDSSNMRRIFADLCRNFTGIRGLQRCIEFCILVDMIMYILSQAFCKERLCIESAVCKIDVVVVVILVFCSDRPGKFDRCPCKFDSGLDGGE